ncbi:hypothetical protein [Bifidobacterium ramosum]
MGGADDTHGAGTHDVNGAHDENGSNDAHGSGGTSFSDEELEAALAGFEQEFNDAGNGDSGSADAPDSSAADVRDDGISDGDGSDSGDHGNHDDLSAQFEDELAGLLGNKAKAAVIITRIASARLLAALCQLSDISADCIGSPDGAIAVLRNLDGDGPEAAARDITIVVSGLTVVLAVNRADKLEATMYLQGKPEQTFAPPILFSATPPFVEDLMLGISSLDDLKRQGTKTIASASMDRDQALAVLAEHTKTGRGGTNDD